MSNTYAGNIQFAVPPPPPPPVSSSFGYKTQNVQNFNGQTPPNLNNPTPSPVRRGGGFSLRSVICIAVALVVAVFGIFWGTTHSRMTPKSTVRSLFFAMEYGSTRGIERCIDPTITSAINVEDLSFLNEIIEYELYPYLDPEIVDCQATRRKATVTVLINSVDLKTLQPVDRKEIKIYLKKVHFKWYVTYPSPLEVGSKIYSELIK